MIPRTVTEVVNVKIAKTVVGEDLQRYGHSLAVISGIMLTASVISIILFSRKKKIEGCEKVLDYENLMQ